MTPSQFYKLSLEDRALMLAHERAFSDMQAYEAYLQVKESEKAGKKGKA